MHGVCVLRRHGTGLFVPMVRRSPVGVKNFGGGRSCGELGIPLLVYARAHACTSMPRQDPPGFRDPPLPRVHHIGFALATHPLLLSAAHLQPVSPCVYPFMVSRFPHPLRFCPRHGLLLSYPGSSSMCGASRHRRHKLCGCRLELIFAPPSTPCHVSASLSRHNTATPVFGLVCLSAL